MLFKAGALHGIMSMARLHMLGEAGISHGIMPMSKLHKLCEADALCGNMTYSRAGISSAHGVHASLSDIHNTSLH